MYPADVAAATAAPVRSRLAYGLKIPPVPKPENGDPPYGLLLLRLTKSSSVPWYVDRFGVAWKLNSAVGGSGGGVVRDVWAEEPKRAPTPAAVRELPGSCEDRFWFTALRSLLLLVNGVAAAELELTVVVASAGGCDVEVVMEGERREVSEVAATVRDPADEPDTLASEEFPLLLLVVFSVLFGERLAGLVGLVDDDRWYSCICTRWIRSDSDCRDWMEEAILASKAWTSPKR